MKKLLIVAAMALSCAATSVIAQERAAGAAGASAGTIGGIATGTIVAGSVAAGVVAAVVSNNRSSTVETTEPVLTCNGTDPLVSGVCIGTTNTVTVSGTGTVSVPVTFTYAPTLQ